MTTISYFFHVYVSLVVYSIQQSSSCQIPLVIRGSWFSWENGRNTLTEINAETMTDRGRCVDMIEEYHVNYTFVFQHETCYHCVKLIVRTVNVLEKLEGKVYMINLKELIKKSVYKIH